MSNHGKIVPAEKHHSILENFSVATIYSNGSLSFLVFFFLTKNVAQVFVMILEKCRFKNSAFNPTENRTIFCWQREEKMEYSKKLASWILRSIKLIFSLVVGIYETNFINCSSKEFSFYAVSFSCVNLTLRPEEKKNEKRNSHNFHT